MIAALRHAMVGAFAVAALVGCSDDHGPSLDSPAAASVASSMPLAPPVDHVHGAVVAGSALLLGTHSGLVEVDLASGRAERRGAGQDDLMGLTADGAVLYASGHPGPGTDLPDPLGLLRSDDRGMTWTSVSLTGEVDFHGLAADGQRMAGIGTEHGVKLSEDGGASWTDLGIADATSLAWFQGSLWVTTSTGLRVWRDGALDTPALETQPVVVAAADDGTALWAVTPDGGVWRTTDGGVWSRHGTITALEALAATATVAYAVTASDVAAIDAD